METTLGIVVGSRTSVGSRTLQYRALIRKFFFFCVLSVWLITVNSAISIGFIKHIWWIVEIYILPLKITNFSFSFKAVLVGCQTRESSFCSCVNSYIIEFQDGLLLNSRCTLYKTAMEEVSIWGWPLQTAGLLKTGFSSRSFTILSGRVTEVNTNQNTLRIYLTTSGLSWLICWECIAMAYPDQYSYMYH